MIQHTPGGSGSVPSTHTQERNQYWNCSAASPHQLLNPSGTDNNDLSLFKK